MTGHRCSVCRCDCDSLPGPGGEVVCLSCQEDKDGEAEADNTGTVD